MSRYPDLRLLIGGDWTTTARNQPVINPADETVLGALPLASQSDLEAAVATVDHAVEAEGTSSYYFMLQMQVLTDV